MVPYKLFAGTSLILGVDLHFVLAQDTSNSPSTVGSAVGVAVTAGVGAYVGTAVIGSDGAALGCSPPVLQI